jgi:hypothetical protein
VDASEALLKGVKGIFSVKAFDMAGTDAERGAAPPLNMDAFSFELYMQRRSLPPLEDSVSHSRLEQERARTTKVTASDRNGEGKVTYSEALLDERYEPWGGACLVAFTFCWAGLYRAGGSTRARQARLPTVCCDA